MRALEVLLLLSLLLAAVSLFFRTEKRARRLPPLSGLSICIVVVHVLLEGHRWQMLPAYVYTVFFFVLAIWNLRFLLSRNRQPEVRDRPLLRFVAGTLGVLLLIAVAAPPLLVPVFKLPSPTGPHAVGTRYDYFVDVDGTDYREVSVQIWYPASPSSDDRPARYWERAGEKSRIISAFWGGLPRFLFSHFSLVRTHSFPDANLSNTAERYPVLIFNHGSIGLPSLNTALMEELASNGFVVFGIGHADYSPFFIRQDGTIKAFDPNAEDLRLKMRENDDPEVRRIAQDLMQSQDLEEQQVLLRQFLEKNPNNQRSLFRWAEDISFTVDELERLNRDDSIFSGRLDLERLGIFGVSFGGAASIQACARDSRCKAAMSMDCPQFGDFIDRVAVQPMMFLSSEQYEGKNDMFLELKDNPLHLVSIEGTTHQNLSDLSIWGPMFRMSMLGSIDGERALEIQNRYVLAFFDKYLRDIDSQLLTGTSPEYPEVEIKAANLR